MITCSILLDGCEDDFFGSFIYSSNYVEERKEVWEDLRNHQHSPMFRYKLWMIFGDFNDILDAYEHSGFLHSSTINYGMRYFQEVIRYSFLIDMVSHVHCSHGAIKGKKD